MVSQPPPELYRRLKLLGEGSFGKAYLVESLRDSSLSVIKQLDLSHMSEETVRETLKEARVMEVLQHPNVIRFKEVYKTKKNRLCIVMEYAENGDLQQKIKQQSSSGRLFSEQQILDWFTQMCLAIKHVHDRKIIHRDLKTPNIFLTKDNTIKVGDFGIAKVLAHTREKAKTVVGTPYYLSPEIIEGKEYSTKTDIWSLGIILYEMCALSPPFKANNLSFLALKIVKGSYSPIPSVFSGDLAALISKLLNVDPEKRPSVHEVLSNLCEILKISTNLV